MLLILTCWVLHNLSYVLGTRFALHLVQRGISFCDNVLGYFKLVLFAHIGILKATPLYNAEIKVLRPYNDLIILALLNVTKRSIYLGY